MAIPAWPLDLPDIAGNAASFRATLLGGAVAKTEFDDGPNLRRNRKLFRSTPLSVALVLTEDQLEVFQRFVERDLNNGARRFSAPVVRASLQITTGICQIDSEPAVTPFGLQWTVAFTVIVWDW
jgi:hypothetical protein